MATKFTFKRKLYTRYDATDNLKRMKDSDILAEKPKDVNNFTGVARNAITGATAAGVGGLALGAARGLTVKGSRLASAGRLAGKYGKIGAIGGALVGAGLTVSKNRKQAEDNQFYNERLAYAKRQALRREKKDWKTNMTQRDGYSY